VATAENHLDRLLTEINIKLDALTTIKNMTREEFWKLYNDKEFEKILPILNSGETFGFDLKQYTLQSSWSKDYEQLHFLWRMKAEAYTPFIKNVFERFENGESYEVMLFEKQVEKQRKLNSVKADLTNFKSVNQIPFGEITFDKNDETTFRLTLPLLPYLYDGYVCENEFIIFSPIEIDKNNFKNGQITFEKNQFDESIYLFNSHNPVDLKSIEFSDFSENSMKIKITLEFLFAFEGNGNNQIFEKTLTVPYHFEESVFQRLKRLIFKTFYS
jgi:hypothetical protein